MESQTDSALVSANEASAQTSWTCERCGVTASWMPGATGDGRPVDWSQNDAGTHCLGCRRSIAGEASLEAADVISLADRAKARAAGVVEFEIRRTPERSNGQIARACRTSVPAVIKARVRIGIPLEQ